jgi:hypothetical protein
MIRSLTCITFLAVALALTAQQKPVTMYVQLIRGTNKEKPHTDDWKPIGPKLAEQLTPVFRWPHYYEVKRQTATIYPKKTSRIALTDDRVLEIELIDPAQSELRLYRKDKLVRRSRQPFDSKLAIMGGDSERDQSWFIVVRKDKPKDELAKTP